MVMMDTFSKFTKLYPMRKATSKMAIKNLDEFIAEIGKPCKILSDRGTQFTSHRWIQALEERGIRRILTSIRHPQANMVERVNRELARLFRTLLPPDQHAKWQSQIKNIETIINETHHETTEETPYEALWGRRPKRWWNDILPHTPPQPEENRNEQILVLKTRIRRKREKLLERINKKKRGVKFQVGDWVLVKACNVSNPAMGVMAKFLALYEGPYRIKKQISTNVYIVSRFENDSERGQYHSDDLRKYHRRDEGGRKEKY